MRLSAAEILQKRGEEKAERNKDRRIAVISLWVAGVATLALLADLAARIFGQTP